ncbi:MAG: S8 family serine peptidase, partial [Fulvivirga sp.]|nr:S8 family serine peptidase [Fulvivirga sp.]
MKLIKLNLLLILLCFYVSLAEAQPTYNLPDGIEEKDISQEFIVVKLKADTGGGKSGRKGSQSILANRAHSRFLTYLNDQAGNQNIRYQQHPLRNIYKVRIGEDENPVEVINNLLQHDDVLYAEPYFKHERLFIPDDPHAQPGGNQWYLSNIRAYDAWTIEKGDTSIVIGVLDSGVLPQHRDFADNLYINLDDPINGIDDDLDGLVDNRNGWDIADNDNNPIADTDLHGHQVTGVSSASTNNGLDIAGVGFKSRFLPIKIFKSGSDIFANGYEGIALAADLGCQVINLSWGSANSFSQAGQDIINYAVEVQDAVIVAAAGNTNAQLDFYPASFKNVLSVGASNQNDVKADFATFSYNIDLMAPGKSIFVSNGLTSFSTSQGTSFSSPMVAGAAALVRSRFPDLNAKQVMERLRVNADDIYEIPGNENFTGLLGKGRLNIHEALTNDISPSVRIEHFEYTNGLGKYAFFGDTLSIAVNLKNYLTPTTTNARAVLSSPTENVIVLQPEFRFGKL